MYDFIQPNVIQIEENTHFNCCKNENLKSTLLFIGKVLLYVLGFPFIIIGWIFCCYSEDTHFLIGSILIFLGFLFIDYLFTYEAFLYRYY